MSKENETPSEPEELLIDTSKMNEGAREAMEIAEASRQMEWAGRSFVAQLFMGNCDMKMIMPFPRQSEEERKIGDEMVEKVSRYLLENLNPDEVDATGVIPEKVMTDMFEMGLFAMKIGKEYGGLGLSQVNYNRVMMAVSSYCASTAVLLSAHQSIGVPQPLKMYGTEEQKKQFLPRFRKDAVSAFALTEPEVGSDPARMKTTAELTEDGKFYIINGTKQWCTNAPIAAVIVVMAKTRPKMIRGQERQQISAFIVEMNTPGVEVIQRCDFMGLKGMQNGLVKFTDVKVPAENLVMGEGRGLKMALATLNIGRLTVPAACTGVGKQCLSIARRFARSREQWGKPVGKHEFVAEKLSFIATTTFAMEAVTWLSSHFADLPDSDLRLEAAMAKLFCSEACWHVTDTTLQVLGGRGYETATSKGQRGEPPYPVERMMRDCRINTIIEGSTEIMKLFIARETLDPHFKIAGPLLKKSSTLGQKASTLLKAGAYYGWWFPRQCVGAFLSFGVSGTGKLGGHIKFIRRNARRLAARLFYVMMRYQAGLEKRQLILGRFVEIGMELFAMAASCSYALSLQKEKRNNSPISLADTFCRGARRRIKAHFKAICCNDDKVQYRLAREVLDNQYDWLEHPIIWIGPKE